jgi:shikimate dehydrogenase
MDRRPRIDGHTHVVGLLGYPVEHSLSPVMQNAAFAAAGLNWCYVPLPVAPVAVKEAVLGLPALGFRGANVTIPHKQAVMSHLDEVSEEAQAIGAANVLVFKDGRRLGYNVDGIGFLTALTRLGVPVRGLRALVLGSGGSARAVVYTLARNGAAVMLLNRTELRAKALVESLRPQLMDEPTGTSLLKSGPLTGELVAEIASGVDLVVNTTPLGMSPHEQGNPWPVDVPFPRQAIAYDLIYAPRETGFLRLAKAAGAQTLDGLQMLVYQGAHSFELWTGQPAPVETMFEAALEGSTNG